MPATTLFLLAEFASAVATGQRITPRELVDAPYRYVGKLVVLSDIACVDNPVDGFTCMTTVAGRILRIDAAALGEKTTPEMSRSLIGECKGTANLDRDACRVQAEFTPQTARTLTIDTDRGSQPVVTIYSRRLELYPRPRGKRRF